MASEDFFFVKKQNEIGSDRKRQEVAEWQRREKKCLKIKFR
jgi:hypothetical protein